jgi:predicted acylesterase/phospholipase RssA
MTIKNLVFSGGGPSMIQTIGSLQCIEDHKFIDIKNIETIYGTSAGAIVGTMLCLKFDWETINDYIIKRPWHEVFPINVQNIFDAYTKKGIFDIKTIDKCFKPLLAAKDLSMEITMKELYEYSKIELHFFTFEINNFKLEDISYLTNPDLKLLTALQMTCGIPILVTPVCFEGKCYIDGGIMCNYPLKYCLESGKKEEETLGFKNQYDDNTNHVNSESTLLDFIMCFLFKVIHSLSIDHTQPKIKNELVCNISFLSIDVFRTAMSSIDTRKLLLQSGIDQANVFLQNIVFLQNSI